MLHMHVRSIATHPGGPLLEGRVDEAEVGVVLRLGVHPTADQILDGDLHGLHVNTTCKVDVLVHQVAVPVLLCSPRARPVRPGRLCSASLIAHTVQGVQHGHVCWQRLLRDQIACGTVLLVRAGAKHCGRPSCRTHRQRPPGTHQVELRSSCEAPEPVVREQALCPHEPARWPGAKCPNLPSEIGILRGRKEVSRLPALVHGLEQRRHL
jgi:hypothetical protein